MDHRPACTTLIAWAASLGCLLAAAIGSAGDATDARAKSTGSPIVAEATVPGPGPIPLRLPAELIKAHRGGSTIEESIDLCVTQSMAAADTPGASVAVAVDGELFYQHGYGVKHRQNGGQVDAETLFRIGSVTKQLTAAAVLQQVEVGAVNLDDPITRYVPELELSGLYPAERITVRHLLTHSSGYPDLIIEPEGPTDDGALAAWAADQHDVALHNPPGVFWNYSNPNFNLAGLVVERASGEPYRQYMSSHVFGAAGMSRTTFDPQDVIADGNYSFGHQSTTGGLETIYAPDDYDNAVYAPAGYVFSTAGDLVRWASMLMAGGGPVLSRESASLMQSRQIDLELVPGYAYGFGVMIEPFGELVLRQHGGNIWGWGAYLVWEREHGFAVAVLANTFESLPAAAYCIADLLLDQGAVDPPEDTTDPAAWYRYEGTWDLTTRTSYPIVGEITVAATDELLMYLWDTESSWQLWVSLEHVGYGIFIADLDEDGVPESDFTFLGRGSPERLGFIRNRILVGSPRRAPVHVGTP